MENNIDDKELLGKVSSGSEEAFDYIYLRYSPVVTSYAEALLKDRHTADDICHNIFARLWEKRSSLSGIRSLKAYLFTATKNAVFDVWKQRLPEKESPSLCFLGGLMAVDIVPRKASGASPAGTAAGERKSSCGRQKYVLSFSERRLKLF